MDVLTDVKADVKTEIHVLQNVEVQEIITLKLNEKKQEIVDGNVFPTLIKGEEIADDIISEIKKKGFPLGEQEEIRIRKRARAEMVNLRTNRKFIGSYTEYF